MVAAWFGAAMIFAAGMFHFKGPTIGMEFLTCYLIEWSLSIDNLFVFIMIFQAFGIEPKSQKRALQWGIIGAIVSRLVFIVIGLGIVSLFEPVMYLFGAILIYSAYKMIFVVEEEIDIMDNKIIKFVRRFIPITKELDGHKFFVRKSDGIMATPLFLTLVVIEIFDLMFAIDSIPAAFAISRHALVILSANIFAILGLRSLYFLLAHANNIFVYLRYGIGFVLAFVGVKMLINHYYKIDIFVSLSIVIGTLAISIALSWLKSRQIKS